MTPDPTTAKPVEDAQPAIAGRSRHRRAALALVAIGLAVQVVVAAAAFTDQRPARYGWQMYSAMPVNPPAWSVHAGEERELSVSDLLVHARAEIDYVALLRERGCDLVEADAIRFERSDGDLETVECG